MISKRSTKELKEKGEVHKQTENAPPSQDDTYQGWVQFQSMLHPIMTIRISVLKHLTKQINSKYHRIEFVLITHSDILMSTVI